MQSNVQTTCYHNRQHRKPPCCHEKNVNKITCYYFYTWTCQARFCPIQKTQTILVQKINPHQFDNPPLIKVVKICLLGCILKITLSRSKSIRCTYKISSTWGGPCRTSFGVYLGKSATISVLGQARLGCTTGHGRNEQVAFEMISLSQITFDGQNCAGAWHMILDFG